MEIENLKSKITRFVKRFREGFDRLPEEEKKKVNSSFKAVTITPCQITVVWMAEVTTNRNLQIFIFTHFEDLEDLQVDIVGPFQPSEFSNSAEKLINADKWSRKVIQPKIMLMGEGDLDKPLTGEEYPYSSLIKKILAQAYQLKHKGVPLTLYHSNYWVIWERFQDKDIESFIKTNLIAPTKPIESDSSIRKIKCRYTYFFPPCWV